MIRRLAVERRAASITTAAGGKAGSTGNDRIPQNGHVYEYDYANTAAASPFESSERTLEEEQRALRQPSNEVRGRPLIHACVKYFSAVHSRTAFFCLRRPAQHAFRLLLRFMQRKPEPGALTNTRQPPMYEYWQQDAFPHSRTSHLESSASPLSVADTALAWWAGGLSECLYASLIAALRVVYITRHSLSPCTSYALHILSPQTLCYRAVKVVGKRGDARSLSDADTEARIALSAYSYRTP